MRSRFVVVGSLVFVACGGPSPAPVVVPKSSAPPKPAAAAAPPVETPARWILTDGTIESLAELGPGEAYGFGRFGERWSIRDANLGTPAENIAPERLVGVLREPLRFVGASGAIYPAESPLGALGAPSAKPSGARVVAVGRNTVFAIAGGSLVSTTNGASWQPVSLPVTGARPLDVIADPKGRALLFLGPERFLASLDDGATWMKLTYPIVGVQGLKAQNGLWVIGHDQWVRLEDAPPTLAVRSAGGWSPYVSIFPKSARRPFRPSVGAWSGADWLEVEWNAEKLAFELVAAPFAKPALGARMLRPLTDCNDATVAAHGPSIAVACPTKTQPGTLAISRSNDHGKTFTEAPPVAAAKSSEGQKIWVGDDGVTIVNGACATASAPCKNGIVGAHAGASAFFDVAIDRASPRFDAVSLLGTGRVVAVGTSGSKGATATFFESHDGGRTFASHELPLEAAKPALEIAGRAALAIEAGHVRAIAIGTGEWHLLGTENDGATWAPRPMPKRVSGVAFVGMRGLAATLDNKLFETLDAGAHWIEVRAPEFPQGSDVACGPDPCLVGSAFRIGWDLREVPKDSSAPVATRSRWATPFRCVIAGSKTSLGKASPPGAASRRDGVAWLTTENDDTRADAVLARTTKTGLAIEKVPLLQPKKGFDVHVQVRTTGAVAWTTPRWDAPKKGTWWDSDVAFFGPSSKTVRKGRVDLVPHGRELAPLSAGEDEMVFGVGAQALEASLKEPDRLVVIDGKKTESRGGLSLGQFVFATSARVVRKGKHWLAFGGVDIPSGHGFVATSDGAGWDAHLFAMRPTLAGEWGAFSIVVPTIRASEPHLAMLRFGAGAEEPGFLAKIAPKWTEPPTIAASLPTAAAFADDAPMCEPKGGGLVLSLPPTPGARHPVRVTGVPGIGELLLATDTQATHVPENGAACVVGWDATNRRKDIRAIVVPGAEAQSTLVLAEAGGSSALPMSCAADSTAAPSEAESSLFTE